MDGNGHTRVDLGNGQWAEIRAINAGDLRYQRKLAHERGYEDDVLDALAIIPRVVKAWSFGDVNDDTVDALDTPSMTAVFGAIAGGQTDPNASTPSSGGEGNQPKQEA